MSVFGKSTFSMLATVMTLAGSVAALDQTSPASQVGEWKVVENGHPCSVILASPDISVSERFAVEELQNFIEQMSGSRLQVLAPGQTPAGERPAVRLVVGKKTAEQRHADLRLDALGSEGFVIKTIADDLVIAGGEKRGTLYGVYSFLESLGCRWWTDDASTIPHLPTIRVPLTDRREMPRLEYRDLLYQERWVPSLWGVRNKITNMTGGACQIPEQWGGVGPVFHTNLVHSWRKLIELDGSLDFANKEGPSQPAWFALIQDWQGQPMRASVQPCTRNPVVRQAIVRGALKMLREHPDDLFVTVGQEDGPEYCHCTEFGCAELVVREGSASALVLELANEVADRVAQEYPGKYVMAPAYMWSSPLPKTIRPRDNIIMSVAPIDNDFGHPLASGMHAQNVACRNALEQWSLAAKRIWIWDYTTNFTHYLLPQPNLDVLVPNIKYYADHRVTGYMAQGSHTCINAEFSHLRMWVLAQTLWHPEADNQALVAEFCHGYYGAAGPAMLKYIDTIHRPVRQQADLYVSCYNGFGSAWLSPEVLVEAEGNLREAEAAVASDRTLLDRVRLAHVPLQYVLAVRQPSSGTWRSMEQKFGKIDRSRFALDLASAMDQFYIQPGKPWGMDESGGRPFADFVGYLRQWAAIAGRDGDAWPPEIRGQTDCRIIHPWQIDQQKLAWATRPFADADASDGWVMRAKDEGWTMAYQFVAGDDYQLGKRYTLFVRVKCPQPSAGGKAFSCGIHGKDPLPCIEKSVPTESITPDRYQVVEVGTIELQPGHQFWIATVKNSGGYAVSEVRLDCFWLREAK